jgi:hypothetical protein
MPEALKVPLRERDALLQRLCGGDENLHRRVEALLSALDSNVGCY